MLVYCIFPANLSLIGSLTTELYYRTEILLPLAAKLQTLSM